MVEKDMKREGGKEREKERENVAEERDRDGDEVK